MDGGNAHAEAVSVTRRRAKNETLKAGGTAPNSHKP